MIEPGCKGQIPNRYCFISLPFVVIAWCVIVCVAKVLSYIIILFGD